MSQIDRNAAATRHFLEQMRQHLKMLYPTHDASELLAAVQAIFQSELSEPTAPACSRAWDETDCLLITYGDSIINGESPPLVVLKEFLDEHCSGAISGVHVLPFYPFSSDDGFSVIDYTAVREDLGQWPDIESIGGDYNLMADLVINHVSSKSEWFVGYCSGDSRYENCFITVRREDDLSQVVRPRATPLLRATETAEGMKQIWCTFSHDQIDWNFATPEVLLEMLRVVAFYLTRGTKILRLDAIGYLWKQAGTTCIHLPQTHEVVRLLRTVCDYYSPGTRLITETNVPNHENLSYFGNRNEAHAIYNFSLAPLLIHALVTGQAEYLKRWMMSMPPAPDGCAYLNFTASHDGIGMRPAEGLLTDHEQSQLVEIIRDHGGLFSTRQAADGTERIYELNIALFDALKGTAKGIDTWQVERFLCSQTIMLGVEGVPAFYIHSLLATPNDTQQVERTGRARSINRHQWQAKELRQRLQDNSSNQARVLTELLRRTRLRCAQAAFHPNATQFTLQSSDALFAFWRQSRDRMQSVFAIHNITDSPQELRLADLNLISGEVWTELLSGRKLTNTTAVVELSPYECMWISNRNEYSSL